MLESIERLPREEYDVTAIINETIDDLTQVALFINELRKFKPQHDDKLKALVKLLKKDPLMSKHKVLIFTEFADTARYLKRQLDREAIEGVDQIDSATKRDRGESSAASPPTTTARPAPSWPNKASRKRAS